MEILNITPFSVAYINGRVNFPGHTLTFIVKGTFELKPDQSAVAADKQLFPTGDEFYPEDKEMKGSPKYSSDFAFFKPKADLLLVGKCFTPQGKKVYSSSVKFQIGSKSKLLNIFGNRYWAGGFSSNTISNPEPFSEMELRYENSFGGNEYKKNPVGKGIDKTENKSGEKIIPIPNILNPGEQIISAGTKLEPGGFGALGQMWVQRSSKLGSYKGSYMQERWPWFPKDFDWSYFNAAQQDMQVAGYLIGDEKVYFENLHPLHSQYHSQLPGLKVRCFVSELNDKKEKHFKEVKMNLDTLWVDMEKEKLVLVWRGVSEIKDEDFEEIQNFLIVSEKITEQSQTTEYYHNLLEKSLFEPEEEVIAEKPIESDSEEDLKLEKELAEADAKIKASLLEAGIDPDNPPQPSEEDKQKELEILKQLGIQEELKEIPLTRKIFIERINKKESFEGEDLRGVDLSDLDLLNINFQNAILSGVSLKNSNLSNSNFTKANLSEADLSGAVLKDAVLKETDLTKSILIKADLTGAVIEEAVFEEAKMHDAQLNEVKGKDSFFSGADLTGAILVNSDLTGSDFSKCIMNKANFKGSNLNGASVEGASGIQTIFTETDLTGLKASGKSNFTKASFQRAKGFESIWEKANLTEADFSFSEMEGANFSSALMGKANFYGANMKFARFAKADLSHAEFSKMNLFQGSLEKANLEGADLSGSNLYGAEFLDSVIKGTKLTFANLKMTKLSSKNH